MPRAIVYPHRVEQAQAEADVESLTERQREALRQFGEMEVGASFAYDEPARLLVTKRQKRAALDALATIARYEQALRDRA